MAAPDYVPEDHTKLLRTYLSPPRRPDSWRARRPGDLAGPQPRGERLGAPGPDQGYLLTLVPRFAGALELAPGEHERDAIAGAAQVALKRASLFGRAPVLQDLTMALTVWGFLAEAPDDLIAFRRPLFQEVASPHHYPEQRRIADLVPDETLRRTLEDVTSAHRADWRSLLATEESPLPSPG